MNPLVVGLVVFACTFGGVLLGMWLRAVLPAEHLNGASEDTIKVGIALIATMTALVLGLVTASAKSSFDGVDAGVKESAIGILTLDRALARFGPETREIRLQLSKIAETRVETIWPPAADATVQLDPFHAGAELGPERIADAIRALHPDSDSQRAIQSRALDLAEGMLRDRWLVVASTESSIPMPFLVILLFWLTITFVSFGLFAPRNATVLSVLFVCAVSVGSAVFLVLEMDGPFTGLLRVSADPLRYALEHINQ